MSAQEVLIYNVNGQKNAIAYFEIAHIRAEGSKARIYTRFSTTGYLADESLNALVASSCSQLLIVTTTEIGVSAIPITGISRVVPRTGGGSIVTMYNNGTRSYTCAQSANTIATAAAACSSGGGGEDAITLYTGNGTVTDLYRRVTLPDNGRVSFIGNADSVSISENGFILAKSFTATSDNYLVDQMSTNYEAGRITTYGQNTAGTLGNNITLFFPTPMDVSYAFILPNETPAIGDNLKIVSESLGIYNTAWEPSVGSANNGLSVSGSNIQLGGTLIQPTTITTSGVNTLALQGLVTSFVSSDPLVIGAGGEIMKGINVEELVEFSTANPNIGSPTFTPNTPSAFNTIYASTVNGSTWVWNGTSYVTAPTQTRTPFFLANTTTDAGNNKNAAIYRNGRIGINTNNPTTFLHINTNGTNASGVRYEDLTSASPATASVGYTGVSANGTVIRLTDPLLSEVDGSVSNELQTISTSGAAGNITLSNGGGTLNLNVNDADASATNEGSLTVSTGTATTSVINSNTSGSTPVTISASTGLSIGEAGNTITLTNTGDTDPSNDLTTTTNFNGDVSGVWNNLQLGTDVVGSAEIAANAVGSSELASTGVTAGSYTYMSGTVDADGRFTSVSNGTTPVTLYNGQGAIPSSTARIVTIPSTSSITFGSSGVGVNTGLVLNSVNSRVTIGNDYGVGGSDGMSVDLSTGNVTISENLNTNPATIPTLTIKSYATNSGVSIGSSATLGVSPLIFPDNAVGVFSNDGSGNVSYGAVPLSSLPVNTGSTRRFLSSQSSASPTYTDIDQIQGVLVSPTAPTNGQTLAYNSTTSQYEPTTPSAGSSTLLGDEFIARSTHFNDYPFFIAGSQSGWETSNWGNGGSDQVVPQVGRTGIARPTLNVSFAASGGLISWGNGNVKSFVPTTGARVRASVNVYTQVIGIDSAKMRIGFFSRTVNMNRGRNGAYFELGTNGTGAYELFAVTCNTTNATYTSLPSSMATLYGNWRAFEVKWASTTTVEFYIDNVLVATHTTNVPDGASDVAANRMYPQLAFGRVGSNLVANSNTVMVDYILYEVPSTRL